jgi:hypothetical protein
MRWVAIRLLLDREEKHMTQDLNLYRVPADLYELLQILLGILGQTEPTIA